MTGTEQKFVYAIFAKDTTRKTIIPTISNGTAKIASPKKINIMMIIGRKKIPKANFAIPHDILKMKNNDFTAMKHIARRKMNASIIASPFRIIAPICSKYHSFFCD